MRLNYFEALGSWSFSPNRVRPLSALSGTDEELMIAKTLGRILNDEDQTKQKEMNQKE
jgi:hypothetical protein